MAAITGATPARSWQIKVIGLKHRPEEGWRESCDGAASLYSVMYLVTGRVCR